MFYWTVRFLLAVASVFVYRIKVSGTENIPQNGAFILCSNHIHSYDPAILAIVIKRQLRFMAKKELFRWKLKGGFFRAMGAFPVDRQSTDLTSYRIAMASLKADMGLVIFSQGTRVQELDIKAAKGGVAFFAVKSKSPIIPVGISGSYRIFSTLNVHFGKAITLEKYYDERLKSELIDDIMAEVMSEVDKLIVRS